MIYYSLTTYWTHVYKERVGMQNSCPDVQVVMLFGGGRQWKNVQEACSLWATRFLTTTPQSHFNTRNSYCKNKIDIVE